jgi:hypothetical protein
MLLLHSTKWHKSHLVSMQYIASILGLHYFKYYIIKNCRIMKKSECIVFAVDP